MISKKSVTQLVTHLVPQLLTDKVIHRGAPLLKRRYNIPTTDTDVDLTGEYFGDGFKATLSGERCCQTMFLRKFSKKF